MITATNSGIKREIVPAGSHVARCYNMIHIGTNLETIQGVEKIMNKVRITWELPHEMREFDGVQKPLVISKEFTLSMHEKSTLRKDLESWRGKNFTEDEAKEFDITKLLGVPCMLSIIHNTTDKGTTYAKIAGVSGLPKGFVCPPQFNPTFEFNFDDAFSDEKVESFPDFIKEKIKSSQEYKALKGGNEPVNDEPEIHVNNIADNDLPF